ncbi:MAG: Ig-like domain-containing protein [Candidatus Korobacteraceae bacterium]
MWCGRVAAGLLAAVLLSSCGGGFFPSSTEITALSLSPTSAYITPTGTQQFTATATFGNNSSGDVTSQVTWSSSSPSIATINSTGLATGVALGSAVITAKSNNSSVTATAPVTVSSKTVVSIAISPTDPSISLSLDQQQQFTATATYSDGTMGNVTTSVTWASSATSVATISSTGLASPVALGSTTISATLGGAIGTTSLTVTQ